MATYTIDQYTDKLNSQVMSFIDSRGIGQAMSTVLAMYVERIFERGENANNQPIGEYNSTDSLYVNPNESPKKFPTKGKTGKTKFKNGNSHKTGFFNSYKDFRQKIGRSTKQVNLNFWGILNKDISSSLQKTGDKYIWGTKKSIDTDKVNGAEKKYGTIVFKVSKKEKTEMNRLLRINLIKYLNGNA